MMRGGKEERKWLEREEEKRERMKDGIKKGEKGIQKEER